MTILSFDATDMPISKLVETALSLGWEEWDYHVSRKQLIVRRLK